MRKNILFIKTCIEVIQNFCFAWINQTSNPGIPTSLSVFKILSFPFKERASLFTTFVFTYLLCQSAFSQVQINSITTTASTCPNDGSITVNAQTNNPPLLYRIVTGPVTQPVQTGNIFNSLPPGNYTIEVSDGNGNTLSRSATIAGNYKALDFNPIKTNPYCSGNSDGKLIGNRILNTGKGPFTWQLISPSPVTTVPQVSDTFNNLPAGNYTMRVTDACGSYRTIVATLTDPVSTNVNLWHQQVEMIQGDSAIVTLWMRTDLYRFPMSYKFQTPGGTYTYSNPIWIDISSPNAAGGYFTVQHAIPNFTYGNSLKITVTDACSNVTTSPLVYARNFTFCPSYSSKFKNCTYETTPHFDINSYNCMVSNSLETHACIPVKFQFIDINTNQVADSGTLIGDPNHSWHKAISGVSIKPIPGNKTYRLTITDGCGKTFTNNYTIVNPINPPPKIVSKGISRSVCIDSVASATINTDYFKSVPHLVMLSGPSKLGSTKSEYAYQNTYAYPDTFSYTSWGGGVDARYNFDIANLAPGKYRFKIIDSCGSEIFDSLEIKKSHVSDLKHKFWYKKGCLGKNQIHYTANAPGNMNVRTLNYTVNSYKYHSTYNINDSIVNLPSGTYIVTFTYNKPNGREVNQFPISCAKVIDTIVIEGYETPEIFSGNSIKCKGNVNMVFLADSSKGVPPYQYEIIAGPQTFPVQSSNVFIINMPGIYTARIYDICGNASTKQVFIDTVSFIPISSIRTCNKVRVLYPSSDYHFYKWTRPNHTAFIGDSLLVDPVTPADTGTYFITKITDINGCKDTTSTSYHISLTNVYAQSKTICHSESVTVGTHTYNQQGTYIDTLVSSNGCDSIIKLNLTVLSHKQHVITRSICAGESIVFGGKIYAQAGIYRDTMITAGCDSIAILNLSLLPEPSVNLGNDISLCEGQTLLLDAGPGYAAYFWNTNFSDSTQNTLTLDTTGKYWVTVKNQYGCKNSDTLEVLSIYSLPLANAGKDTTICYGESIQLVASGGDHYKWSPGGENQPAIQVSPTVSTTYTVTVSNTNNCGSSTDEVTVHVKPVSSKPIFDNSSIEHCFEDGPLTLNANWGDSFLWQPTGDTTSGITVYQEGSYNVIVYNDLGCPASGQIIVNEYCMPRIFVPDAFSPDNNGTHDNLEVFGKYFKNFEMKIFNRWGEIIFSTTDRNIQWDGTYRGEDMPIGSYPWIITYQSVFNEQEEKAIKGSVTLIR